MRTLKELLILTRDEFVKDKKTLRNETRVFDGLCRVVGYMEMNRIITKGELAIIIFFISNNPPKKRYEISKYYYWRPFLFRPRYKYLTKHINKL